MPVRKSLLAYRVEKLNCAQSILAGFRQCRGVTDAEISAARGLGGGRAEDGRCGALHAALSLARRSETRASLRRAFSEQAGSEQCRQIRALKKLRCEDCVRLAAGLLDEYECGPGERRE